tara:strand:- start:1083 stop:1292 length:210 start_codon:yes stop_codon:yes gene_type:complete
MVVYWIVGGMVFAGLSVLGAIIFYTHTYTVGVDISIVGMLLIALVSALMGWGAWGLRKLFLRSRNKSKA